MASEPPDLELPEAGRLGSIPVLKTPPGWASDDQWTTLGMRVDGDKTWLPRALAILNGGKPRMHVVKDETNG